MVSLWGWFALSIVLLSIGLWCCICLHARRAHGLAMSWCSEQPYSDVRLTAMSRKTRRSLRVSGMRPAILSKRPTHRIFEFRVYDHDLHRERTGVLKVNAFSRPGNGNALQPQWVDEAMELTPASRSRHPRHVQNRFESGS